jgi:hypothetical protein
MRYHSLAVEVSFFIPLGVQTYCLFHCMFVCLPAFVAMFCCFCVLFLDLHIVFALLVPRVVPLCSVVFDVFGVSVFLCLCVPLRSFVCLLACFVSVCVGLLRCVLVSVSCCLCLLFSAFG